MAKSVDNYATFVALDRIAGKASANMPAVYYDSEGQRQRLVLFRDDKNGEDVIYKFKWSRDKRHITLPINKKDIYGTSYVEFLRNHPLNKNSPNAVDHPWFKELDDERDATKAIDSFKIRHEAESKALSLKGKEFDEVCKVLGIEGKEGIKLHKLMEFASRNPSAFLDEVNNPNRKATALFRAAVANKIITKHGFRYVYKDTHVGNDEEKAITKIAEDKDLQEVLEKALANSGK